MFLTALFFAAALFYDQDLVPASANQPVDPNTPVEITGPTIGLTAPVQTLGLVSGSNQIATPTDERLAGWFEQSARPSGQGVVFIDGHNPGVFANLARLNPDDIVHIFTANGVRYSYRVRENRLVDNDQIDLDALLNPEGAESTLVLMTCAGKFVEEIGTFDQRTIIIASLIS